ncbi:hypothetical protein OsJ_00988 [Oryza sativa Japonica Group]|uniref:BHLH domain-containing protein n=1 Tax=Oryza sativa subsp. japonica TaxID=39947 RepID=B9EUI1_ORYSJ|nr:hypothetical protein OsJ_00988 [Oryza sativa Japonica Group]
MLSSGGELKSSSLVQQMVWVGTGNSSSSSIMGSLRQLPCSEEQDAASSPASMLFLPQQLLLHASSNSSPCLNIPEVNLSTGLHPLGSFHGDVQQQEIISGMPDQSWRQLLLGGLVGDHEKYSVATALLSKGLDDEASMPHEASAAAYDFYGHGGGAGDGILQASPEASSCKSQLSQMLLQAAASSPRSCVTTSGLGSSMMDFSNTAAVAPAAEPELTRKHHAGQSDNSSECNSTETGSALKKARVQASSSAQFTQKVRKERLGDRITALHQIVSPFGKTDTASVLQETIGYIRFLLGQIELLNCSSSQHINAPADNSCRPE